MGSLSSSLKLRSYRVGRNMFSVCHMQDTKKKPIVPPQSSLEVCASIYIRILVCHHLSLFSDIFIPEETRDSCWLPRQIYQFLQSCLYSTLCESAGRTESSWRACWHLLTAGSVSRRKTSSEGVNLQVECFDTLVATYQKRGTFGVNSFVFCWNSHCLSPRKN